MKRILSFLMCILLVLVAFFGCSENKSSGDENIHTEYEGVYLTLGSVSKSEIKVVWHNDTAKDVIYGEYYYIERYNEESGEWESVLSEDFFVNDIGLLLRPHGENEETYSLEYFELSADGKYRLRSDFFLGDGKTYNTWVEFYTAVKFLHNDYGGWGLSAKIVSDCDIAYSIIDELEKMKETGETVPKISNKPLEEAVDDHLVKYGILWFEVGSKIYRIDPDTHEICRVDEHLGKGYVLDASQEFITLVYKAYQYHPYDFYIGSYNIATETLDTKNVYDAYSTVDVKIKKIEIGEGLEPTNKITLELLSDIDQTCSVRIGSQASSDNLAMGDAKDVAFKAGQTETVEFSFGGWSNFNYYITILADNTKLRIDINQK